VMLGMAFLSGVVLAGLLGWRLLETLRLAGVVGALSESSATHRAA